MNILKKIFQPIDLTKGTPWKVILLFAIPLLINSLLSNAFSIINALVLKATVGGSSVTAINQTGNISSILFNFAYGTTSGFAVLISNKCGSKDEEGIKKVFYNSIFLASIIAIFISIIGLLLYPTLFILLETDVSLVDKAGNYIEIILIAFIFMVLSNLFDSFLRALGNSIIPLIISFFCTLINIGFAFIFTGLIKLDTRGVAIATLLANFIHLLISAIYIYKKYPFLKTKIKDIKLDKKLNIDLLKLGLPLGFQWSILFIGSFVQAKKVNEFGIIAQNAVSCYQSFEGYISVPLSVISTATLSYIGQNYGAKNDKRIKEGIKDSIIIDICSYIIIVIFGLTFAEKVPYIFLREEEVTERTIFYCATYLRTMIPFLICQGVLQISRSTLQGINKTTIPFISGIGELFARIIVCLFIPSLINPSNPLSDESYMGICFSTPFAWVISVLIMGGSVIYIVYIKGIKYKEN